ncbi:MAG TPA: bifunctional demethylmenaquinone methyltransferase/2-methoxy-6-polyprenyl-1,4-benzoquinol methylase UbiE [Gammaproteobacteria bacterium]|nr:bifunctional demethylmenaquinone methyltransferase/2-methoxy-6-polyprenyl-1,4-benzoquinol methylase UbiE [Gammaproteobacteria bacterium]
MKNTASQETTHFGYQDIPLNEKTERVAQVFHSVAQRYDLMNDLMSFGLHRLWKRFTLAACQARPGQVFLDLAAGTGDLAAVLARKVGKTGQVILTDINESMLARGRLHLLDQGLIGNVSYVLADAEQLPFAAHSFDGITLAFGLRNITQPQRALEAMYRVLKPGGKALILEFSQLTLPWLQKLYDLYSFQLIPKLGEWLTRDRQSYEYLVESIRKHPDQESLKSLMEKSGFEDVNYYNLTGGIVALHQGYKY